MLGKHSAMSHIPWVPGGGDWDCLCVSAFSRTRPSHIVQAGLGTHFVAKGELKFPSVYHCVCRFYTVLGIDPESSVHASQALYHPQPRLSLINMYQNYIGKKRNNNKNYTDIPQSQSELVLWRSNTHWQECTQKRNPGMPEGVWISTATVDDPQKLQMQLPHNVLPDMQCKESMPAYTEMLHAHVLKALLITPTL